MAIELNPAPMMYTVVYRDADGNQKQTNIPAQGQTGAQHEFDRLYPLATLINIFRRS